MQAVFNTTELAALILSFARPRDAARLGLTNRFLFDISLPFAWEHVEGVTPIFKLIQSCEILRKPDLGDLEIIEVNLPSQLSQEHLSRLQIYAPFIKRLDIYGDGLEENDNYTVTNTSSLLSYTEGYDLLPNLETVTLNTDYGWNAAFLFWFKFFASKSLLEVRIVTLDHSEVPFICVPFGTCLVEYATRRCPRIKTLAILFEDEEPDHLAHPLEYLASIGPEELLPHALSQAKTLVSLTGSVILFEPDIFEALGQLPLLESLEIWYHKSQIRREISPEEATQAEDTIFPALSQLILRNVILDAEIIYLWRTYPLVKNLTSLEISSSTYINGSDHVLARPNLIPLICTNSPRLTQLRIDFYVKPHCPEYIYRLGEEEFQALSNLRLTRLEILLAQIEIHDSTRRLAMAWPNMKVLNLLAHYVTLGGLFLFATHMPRLQYLAVGTRITPLFLDMDPSLELLLASPRSGLRTLKSDFSGIAELVPEDGRQLYRCLKTLWPRAHMIVNQESGYKPEDLPFVRLLNEAPWSIAQLSSTHGKASSIEEAVEQKWKKIRSTDKSQ